MRTALLQLAFADGAGPWKRQGKGDTVGWIPQGPGCLPEGPQAYPAFSVSPKVSEGLPMYLNQDINVCLGPQR